MIAPFVPFLAESLWQNLAGVFNGRATESVHLCDWPAVDAGAIDEELSGRMALLLEIASLGRAARMEAKLKVRQPLSGVTVILNDPRHRGWLEEHDLILREELNVRSVTWQTEAGKFVSYEVQPNFKRLGPRVGRLMPAVKQALANADGARLLAELEERGRVQLDISGEAVELDGEDLQVRLRAREGWAAAQGRHCVVVLATELTPGLIDEGMARDVVRLVQDRRKELDLEFTDRIELGLVTDSPDLQRAVRTNTDYICNETLATRLETRAFERVDGAEREVSGHPLWIYIAVASGK
jgi:isoleucyl-tRNA synthetase